MPTFLLTASSIALLVVTLAFFVCFLREPWTRHPFGQSVMVLTIGVGLLATLGLLVYALGPEYPGREVLVFTGRVLITIGMAQRLVVLVREQRRDRTRQETHR